MGEMDFRYDVKNKHKLVHAIRYWFNKTTEYGFAYQRLVALYDTRIFDSPVVITKVATGLPYILGPFVYPRQSFDMETLNGFNILKDGKSIEDPLKYAPFFIKKDGKSFLVRNDMFVAPRDVNHAIANDILNVYYARHLDIYKDWNTKRINDDTLNVYSIPEVTQDNPSMTVHENTSGERDVPTINIYDQTQAASPNLIANVDSDVTGSPHDSVVSIYQSHHGCRHTNIMNVAQEVLGRPHDNIGNIANSVLGKPDDNIMNYIPLFMAKRINDDKLIREKILGGTPDQRILQEDGLFFLEKEKYMSNIAEQGLSADIIVPYMQYLGAQYSLERKQYMSDVNAFYDIHKTIGSLEVNKIHNAFRQNPYGDYDHYLLHGRPEQRVSSYEYYMRQGKPEAKFAIGHKDANIYWQPKVGSSYVGAHTFKYGPVVDYTNPFYAVTPEKKYLDITQELWSTKHAKEAVYYANTLTLRDIAYGNYITPTMFASQAGIRAYMNQTVFSNKDRNVSSVQSDALFFSMDRKSATAAKKGDYVIRNNTDIRLYTQMWISGGSKDIAIYPNHFRVYRDRTPLSLYAATFVRKDAQPLSIADNLMVYKEQVNIVVDVDMQVAREINHLFRQDAVDNTHKIRYGMDVGEQINAHRDRPGVFLGEWAIQTHKTVDEMHLQSSLSEAFQDKESVFIEDAASLYLQRRHASYYNNALHLLKGAVSVRNANSIDGVIKSIWHVRLNNFGSSHNGLIVPVTKSYTDVSTFNDEIGVFAHKAGKDAFFTEGAMASVLRKPSFLSGLNYLNAEKMYHDVMMDVYNYFVEKAVIKAFVQQGDWLYHSPYEAFVTPPVTQTFKDAFFGANFDDEVWGAKAEYQTVVYDQIMTDIHKIAFDTHAYKTEFGDKGKYGTYFFYDVLADRTKYDISISNELQASRKDAQMGLYSALPAYNMNRDITMFEPVVCGEAVSRDINVVQQLKVAEKSRKEIEEFLSDFGNWAWVYETPSPFESKVYGIDELLLPEEDPRYEQFEDIIFDKETMTPRGPIKMLGPTSFLARYPIEMPVEEYADVGVFYDDSAQKWEQYFGIETDVMKDIYLKYYQIWQAKIFEFSTMTMVQSTKKMLEYLYTWIDMYYPIDKMQQALRVFRQIRWYSESAVIRNSQYIISYEYDTLKSNLHTGTCHVPNDLDSITNPTMYVDKKNAVIRNDKAFLGQDAHVTFEIDVQKNTYIKFDLFTEYGKGTALIYLNDKLVRACTSAALGVIIQLPYTGDVNRVTIIKTGVNNIGEFYVGNISVPNATFKNLSIEYDPVLRAGNKPLEEVAKKMIACANLYADKNEMYAVIKRSSLGFSETYRQMNDYWKLHHQDKAKGKRLTIKQT